MNIQDAWLTRFKEIVQSEIDAAGGRASDGYRAVAAKSGLGYAYIYQIFTGKPTHKPKSPSRDAMTVLERKYGKAAPGVQVSSPASEANLDDLERPVIARRTPVVGTARMGDNGFYEELGYPVGHGDGWVDNYSSDPSAFALRVKGDSMHPAIRHGSFVVIEPNGQCVAGEYVVLSLKDGRKMVKELVIERAGEIVIESVNGNHRQTIDKEDIDKLMPVSAVVAASKWRSN